MKPLDLGTVTAVKTADGKWKVMPKPGWTSDSRTYETLEALAEGESLDPHKVRELAME